MTRRLATSTVALALTLALAGCGSEATDPTIAAASTVAGVYPLRTYNGADVPLVIGQNETQGKLELTSGHVTLKEDGTFAESMSYRLTPPTGEAIVDSLGGAGRYTTTGNTITFTFVEGDMVTGRLENETITIAGQATFVYRR